jgi:MarR-like DNA-binding transcriptional regulator SgrR of sgrS sRNA
LTGKGMDNMVNQNKYGRIPKYAATITAFILALSCLFIFPDAAFAYIWPSYDGTLRVPVADSNLRIDPSRDMTYDELGFFYALYDCLFVIDDSDNVRQNLVESYQTSDNLTRYVFNLKGSIAFSDSTKLKSSDVISALESNLRRIGDRADAFDNIAQMQVTDENSFEIKLKIADPDLPRKLAHPFCAITKGAGNEVSAGLTSLFYFTGTGPFLLDEVGSHRIRLTRNENYHRGKAYLKAIEFEIAPYEEESFLLFASGKLDIHRVPFTQYGELMRRQGVNLSNRIGLDTIILDFAHHSTVGSLISYVNPSELVNVILNHAGSGATGILPDDQIEFPSTSSFRRPSSNTLQIVLGYYGDKNLLEPVARRIATEWESYGLTVQVIRIDSYPNGLCDAVVRLVKTMGQESGFVWRSTRSSLGTSDKMPLNTDIFSSPEKEEEREYLGKGRFLPIARPYITYALSDNIRNFRLIAGCIPDYWSISLD